MDKREKNVTHFQPFEKVQKFGRFSLRKSTHTQKSFQTSIFPFVLIQRESSQCVFRQKKTERFALKRLSLFLCLVKATEKRGYDESLSVIFCANPCSHPASVKKGTFQTHYCSHFVFTLFNQESALSLVVW